MASLFQQRALRGTPDGASSSFTKAKKLADLAIKTSFINGKASARGYEQAIEILTPYVVSDGNEGIDAQRLVAGYTNSFTKLSSEQSKNKRSVAEFKNLEREIFMTTASSSRNQDDDVFKNLDVLVSDIAEELQEHSLDVMRSIEKTGEVGEDTVQLENYLFELNRRARTITELSNDLLLGAAPSAEALSQVGLFVQTDKDDGEVLGVGIMPIGDLPFGITETDFSEVDASANLGGAYMTLRVSNSVNPLGETVARMGNKQWSRSKGATGVLTYDKKNSGDKAFKGENGGFSFGDDFRFKSQTSANQYFRGYVGFDEEDNPKQQYFFNSPDGQTYALSEEDLQGKLNDPTQKDTLLKAPLVETSYAKNIIKSGYAKPLSEKMAPAQEHSELNIDQSGTALRATTSPTSFFGNRDAAPASIEAPVGRNIPTPPQEPTVSKSTPDIVEQGKSFFRKAAGFFSNRM